MDTVLNLYKRKSETPLQTMGRFVASHPEYAGVKMTYAGRLDPMAEGVLVALSGEKNKERDQYTGMDKDYEFELAFGVETDTLDTLGLVTSQKTVGDAGMAAPTLDQVNETLKKYKGRIRQVYPAYSSKVVDGTPLFEYARRGVIGSVVMPSHEVSVSALEAVEVRQMAKTELWKGITEAISAVTGDFRQKHILEAWKGYFEASAPEMIYVYKLKVSCGSGFYVRQLVSDLGKDFGCGAVTLSIVRTRVGEYKIEDSMR
jgi:tRNA pseudouridine55 synthase